MNLYTLATTKNVDLNYQSFKKRELIECLSNLRTTYFSLKEQNKKYKEVIDKAKKRIEKGIYIIPKDTNEILGILKEVK